MKKHFPQDFEVKEGYHEYKESGLELLNIDITLGNSLENTTIEYLIADESKPKNSPLEFKYKWSSY